jgi:hypothetical protein
MLKHSLAIMLIASTAVLTGCGGATGCNDSSVKDKVMDLINTELAKDAYHTQLADKYTDTGISQVQTTAHDDDLKTAQCHALYSFTYKGHVMTSEFNYETSVMEDTGDTYVKTEIDDIKHLYRESLMTYGL